MIALLSILAYHLMIGLLTVAGWSAFSVFLLSHFLVESH